MIHYFSSSQGDQQTLLIGNIGAIVPGKVFWNQLATRPRCKVLIPKSYIWSSDAKLIAPQMKTVSCDCLQTGKVGFMGDHNCLHSKVNGDILPNASKWAPWRSCPFWTIRNTDGTGYFDYNVLTNVVGPYDSVGQNLYICPDYRDTYDYCIEGSYHSTSLPLYGNERWINRSFMRLIPIGRSYNYYAFAIESVAIDFLFYCKENVWFPICESKRVDMRLHCVRYANSSTLGDYYTCALDPIILAQEVVYTGGVKAPNRYAAFLTYKPTTDKTFKGLNWDDCRSYASSEFSKDIMDARASIVKISNNLVHIQDFASGIPNNHSGVTKVTQASMSYKPVTLFSPNPPLAALVEAQRMGNVAKKLLSKAYFPSDKELGELAQTCAENCRTLDINSISYCRDLIGAKKEITAFRDLLLTARKALSGDPSSLTKVIADLELSYKYGARLTLSDTVDIVKGLGDTLLHEGTSINGYSVARAMEITRYTDPKFSAGDAIRECHYKIYHKSYPEPFIKSIVKLMNWDFWPTFENLWDLVPFSFVVDWFVSVGDLLETIDDNIYLSLLDVGGVLWSCKDKFPIGNYSLTPDCTLTGAEIVVYHRHLRSLPHVISSQLSIDGKFNHHFLEAAALVVQHL